MRNLALLPEHRDQAEQMKAELFAWYRPPEKQLSSAGIGEPGM